MKKTNNEYLLLENRQWTGWDAGVPGKGLAIFHVNYDASAWSGNSVNSYPTEAEFRYKMVHADGLTYDQWKEKISADSLSNYRNSLRMNKRTLSASPFPFGDNTKCEVFDGKAITNIQQTDDGLISFDFMGGDPSPVEAVRRVTGEKKIETIYDMAGRRVQTPVQGQLYIVRYTDGEIVKYHKK